jgi:DNA-binding winged helix-turn-helix (wHTH) protein
VKSRFGEFVLDPAARQIRRRGEDVHLSRKAFDVLCTLVTRRPNVVVKEDLLKEIWPDTFVTDANLNVVIGEIRRAIGDDAHAPRFVRTAHGVGYAFCGEVVDLDGSAPRASAEAARAWLVGGHRTFSLSDGDNVIGRDPQCAVWLDDSGVSRRHARLRVSGEDKNVTLQDLQSTNGTFVGRRRVNGEVALTDGDVIKVGTVELEFRAPSESQRATRRIRRRRKDSGGSSKEP